MTRQYFADMLNEPPLVNQSAITATVETALMNAAQFAPIPANDGRAGKVYRLIAGGIMSFAATGSLTITPRFGLTVGAGISMGASPAQTSPGVTTNQPWRLEMDVVVRNVGAPGVNSTVIGVGKFLTNGVTGDFGLLFGGTQATVDLSIPTGITIGWTLSVAGSITPQYGYLQSMN
jgi:hypothetical protein